jgi:hypothetical protein
MLAALALGVVLLSGCFPQAYKRDNGGPSYGKTTMPPAPEPAALVRYLNENAQKVQGLQAEVAIDAKEGMRSVGLDGYLACSAPRNFRLKAKAIGKPAADIGSNDKEFWFWISQDNPPYVYHCSYADLATGRVNIPFPFQPDMITAALGLAIYDDKKAYTVRENGQFLELHEDTLTPQGQPVDKVTVFSRMQVRKEGEPQVRAHVLRDPSQRDPKRAIIAQAVIHSVVVNRETGAVVPQHVTLSWPAQRMEMEMRFRGVQVVRFDADSAARLFQRTELSNLVSYDLARRVVDGPGVQRAGAFR